jgi:asparagine synthase (glutamine-hydrolysing)
MEQGIIISEFRNIIMCGIAGLYTLDHSQNVGSDLVEMLKAIEHRGPDGSGIYIDGNTDHNSLEHLKITNGSFGLGHNLLSIVGTEVSQPIERDNFVLIANAEIYNFREIKKCYKDNYKTDSDCEVIISTIKRLYKGSLLDAVKKSLKILDGDYAFAIYDGNDCVVVRDPLGVKPVYYGEDPVKGLYGFASERKALWKIGIKDVNTLKPDHALLNGKPHRIREDLIWNHDQICSDTSTDSCSIKDSHSNKKTVSDNNYQLNQSKSYKNSDKSDIKNLLKNLLTDSVEKRIRGLSEVGIIFSGGVDSTILAKLSVDLGIDTTLYTVGLETSSDMIYAKKTAMDMDLPLKIKTLTVPDVKIYTELVLNAIEEFNLMKLGVGMPAYIASEMAADDNLKVVLSGQGADEIFAGYHRYQQFYMDKGENTQEDLKEDVLNIYHVNLQRDDAVTMANSVELRVPYLDLELVDMALNIPMKYKMYDGADNLRKCILRDIAADIGVPSEIVRRPKKAAQYGSGIHKILVKKVLKDENYRKILEERYKI